VRLARSGHSVRASALVWSGNEQCVCATCSAGGSPY
jgi:hypothetical protein